ncbi:MAG: tetratricopeptide repeat protein, partial [Pseudomonadota bacterium]
MAIVIPGKGGKGQGLWPRLRRWYWQRQRRKTLLMLYGQLGDSTGMAYHQMATLLLKEGRLEAALTIQRWAVEWLPANAGLWVQLSQILEKLEQDAASIGAVQTAIRLDPNAAIPYHRLAWLLSRQGELAEAVAVQRTAAKLMPNHGDIIKRLCDFLEQTGNFEEAIQVARSLVELDPGQAQSHARLADLYLRADQPQEALIAQHRAVSLAPNQRDLLARLCKCQEKACAYEEGLATARLLVRWHGNWPEAHHYLALFSQTLARTPVSTQTAHQIPEHVGCSIRWPFLQNSSRTDH